LRNVYRSGVQVVDQGMILILERPVWVRCSTPARVRTTLRAHRNRRAAVGGARPAAELPTDESQVPRQPRLSVPTLSLSAGDRELKCRPMGLCGLPRCFGSRAGRSRCAPHCGARALAFGAGTAIGNHTPVGTLGGQGDLPLLAARERDAGPLPLL